MWNIAGYYYVFCLGSVRDIDETTFGWLVGPADAGRGVELTRPCLCSRQQCVAGHGAALSAPALAAAQETPSELSRRAGGQLSPAQTVRNGGGLRRASRFASSVPTGAGVPLLVGVHSTATAVS